MVGKKLFSVGEIALGLFFIVCVFFNGRETSFSNSLGFDLNIKTAVMAGGAFYLIRGVVQMISELAEPTSKSFMKKSILFFEVITAFVMMITGFCDGRETIIEKAFDTEIILHHGLVFLGMLYASKAVLQLVFEDNSVV
jgi:hypothetical protein